MKIKVSELAKIFGLSNEQMVDFLAENNISISNQFEVELEDVKKVEIKLIGKTNLKEHTNVTSLKYIKIYGLFGKYNYKINFINDILIIVSENGCGKTTILNLLVAILKGNREILISIPFNKIEININNKKYYIDKSNLSLKSNDEISELLRELRPYLPYSAFDKLSYDYKKSGYIDFDYLDETMNRHARNRGISSSESIRIFRRLQDIIYNQDKDIFKDLYEIKAKIADEVLFYPTYRRIEDSVDKVFMNHRSERPDYISDYAKFGMEDVKRIIKSLLKKMSDDANTSYAEMNGSIISDLLKGISIQTLVKDIPVIDKHKVDVIIKRIGQSRIESIEQLNSFVNNNAEMDNPNEDFLKFYLDRLVKIYDSQKALDDKLRKFADICTKYLVNKKVIYDEAMLSIGVLDNSGDEIEFDELSSGEKQVISIFTKVYLDVTTSCICIIDEPEISLSIKWQKDFLLDIYNSGKVGLLVATTHSPFIYKNELREYTNELAVFLEG